MNAHVANIRGFLNILSRYMRSPPDRGKAVPRSRYTARPQNETRDPKTHNVRLAPTLPTD